MKKWMTILLTVVMMLSLAACGSSNNSNTESASQMTENNETIETTESKESVVNETGIEATDVSEVENEEAPDTGNNNVLVVYFSRAGSSYASEGIDATSSASLAVGNTAIIANQIQEMTGGDLFQIVTVNPYPEDYRKTTDVAKQEQGENARPELSTHVEDMDSYDVIFLGYPNWWGTIPMPLFTFLEEYDFSGKTIIPFSTHEGSSLGRSVDDIKKLCPDSEILEGLAIRGGNVETKKAKEDVADWLSSLGMTE